MNKHNIVFLDAYTNNPGDLSFAALENLGMFCVYDRTSMDQLSERAANADIIIVNKFPVNETSLAMMPKVKYICVAATGFNNIDIVAVSSRGIQVSNVQGYSKDSVAQHVFACLLSFINRPEYYSKQVSEGRWSSSVDFCFYDHTIGELAGKTMGIYGYGTIGKKVGEIAHAFGMEVLSVVRNMKQEKPDFVKFVSHNTLMATSDFISLHCPLTDLTHEIINLDNLKKMKPTTIIINTGRGGLVNESDLKYALDHDIICGVILDVLQEEPPKEGNELVSHHKCMITPHQAWASKEAREKLLNRVASNIKSWINGEWINRIY